MNEHRKILWDDLNSVPKLGSIYKYSNVENGLKCLENSTLYFKCPTDFNDADDCNPSLISISDAYINQTAKDNGIKTPISIRTHQKQYVSMKLLITKTLKDELIPDIKITCFSKKYNTTKMWKCYSGEHTGICIEFDTVELILCLPAALKLNNVRGFFLHVNYTDTPQKFVYGKVGDTTTLLKWVSSKTKKWDYEDEIRYVIPEWKENIFKISAKVIKSVYLGIDISPIDEARVRQFCMTNFPNAQITKMTASDFTD